MVETIRPEDFFKTLAQRREIEKQEKIYRISELESMIASLEDEKSDGWKEKVNNLKDDIRNIEEEIGGEISGEETKLEPENEDQKNSSGTNFISGIESADLVGKTGIISEEKKETELPKKVTSVGTEPVQEPEKGIAKEQKPEEEVLAEYINKLTELFKKRGELMLKLMDDKESNNRELRAEKNNIEKYMSLYYFKIKEKINNDSEIDSMDDILNVEKAKKAMQEASKIKLNFNKEQIEEALKIINNPGELPIEKINEDEGEKETIKKTKEKIDKTFDDWGRNKAGLAVEEGGDPVYRIIEFIYNPDYRENYAILKEDKEEKSIKMHCDDLYLFNYNRADVKPVAEPILKSEVELEPLENIDTKQIIRWMDNETYLRTKKWEKEPKFLIVDFRFDKDNVVLKDKYGHQEFVSCEELYRLNNGEKITEKETETQLEKDEKTPDIKNEDEIKRMQIEELNKEIETIEKFLAEKKNESYGKEFTEGIESVNLVESTIELSKYEKYLEKLKEEKRGREDKNETKKINVGNMSIEDLNAEIEKVEEFLAKNKKEDYGKEFVGGIESVNLVESTIELSKYEKYLEELKEERKKIEIKKIKEIEEDAAEKDPLENIPNAEDFITKFEKEAEEKLESENWDEINSFMEGNFSRTQEAYERSGDKDEFIDDLLDKYNLKMNKDNREKLKDILEKGASIEPSETLEDLIEKYKKAEENEDKEEIRRIAERIRALELEVIVDDKTEPKGDEPAEDEPEEPEIIELNVAQEEAIRKKNEHEELMRENEGILSIPKEDLTDEQKKIVERIEDLSAGMGFDVGSGMVIRHINDLEREVGKPRERGILEAQREYVDAKKLLTGITAMKGALEIGMMQDKKRRKIFPHARKLGKAVKNVFGGKLKDPFKRKEKKKEKEEKEKTISGINEKYSRGEKRKDLNSISEQDLTNEFEAVLRELNLLVPASIKETKIIKGVRISILDEETEIIKDVCGLNIKNVLGAINDRDNIKDDHRDIELFFEESKINVGKLSNGLNNPKEYLNKMLSKFEGIFKEKIGEGGGETPGEDDKKEILENLKNSIRKDLEGLELKELETLEELVSVLRMDGQIEDNTSFEKLIIKLQGHNSSTKVKDATGWIGQYKDNTETKNIKLENIEKFIIDAKKLKERSLEALKDSIRRDLEELETENLDKLKEFIGIAELAGQINDNTSVKELIDKLQGLSSDIEIKNATDWIEKYKNKNGAEDINLKDIKSFIDDIK